MTDRAYEQKYQRFNQISRQYRRIIAVLFMVIIILIILLFTSRATVAHADQQTVETYSSICIFQGDSLWSIAEEHKPADMTVKQYMNKIVAINHLTDTHLISGQYLIIPVYSIPD